MKPAVRCLFQLVTALVFLTDLRCHSRITLDLQTVRFPETSVRITASHPLFTLKVNCFRVNFVYGGCYFSSYFHLNVRPPLCKRFPCTIFLSVKHEMVSHNCFSVSVYFCLSRCFLFVSTVTQFNRIF